MIYGIGTDLVETKRINEAISKNGDRFINKIFSLGEIKYCKNKIKKEIYYSARFAAKEAFLKAIGTGLNANLTFKDIEVEKNEKGKPFIKETKKIKSFFKKNNISKCYLSMSHTKNYATAVIILEGSSKKKLEDRIGKIKRQKH